MTMDKNRSNSAQMIKTDTPHRSSHSFRRILPLSLCVNAFCALTVIFFSPLEVYYGNIIQFQFSIGEIWWILFGSAIALAAAATLVECLLPYTAALYLNAAAFGIGLCCYIQATFLNFKMGSLTGEKIAYDRPTVILDLLLWALLLAGALTAAVLLIRRKKEPFLRKAMLFAAAALIAMQSAGFVSNLLTVDTAKATRSLSAAHRFDVSYRDNTLYFVLDTLDQNYLEDARKEFPDIFDGLDGFTYYPNATSTHSRTYPSLPYLLTGQIGYLDRPYKQYITEAYEKSDYLPQIRELGANIGIYTDPQYVSEKAMDLLDNSTDQKTRTIAKKGVIFQMTKIALFRDMPYLFKSHFVYDSNYINQKIVRLPDGQPGRCTAADDLNFYHSLKKEGLRLDTEHDKTLRFYHFWTAHPGSFYDENMVRVGDKATREQSIRGSFRLIQAYIAEMKRLGVYDRSTIIITADHGNSKGTSKAAPLTIDVARPVCMLVKTAGSSTGFTVSDAPVAHADLFSTVLSSFGADKGKTEKAYGLPIESRHEGDRRTRYYYHTALYDDIDGEIALREYEVNGDARDLASYRLTGRDWDVLYSERAVSKHRLSDVKKK